MFLKDCLRYLDNWSTKDRLSQLLGGSPSPGWADSAKGGRFLGLDHCFSECRGHLQWQLYTQNARASHPSLVAFTAPLAPQGLSCRGGNIGLGFWEMDVEVGEHPGSLEMLPAASSSSLCTSDPGSIQLPRPHFPAMPLSEGHQPCFPGLLLLVWRSGHRERGLVVPRHSCHKKAAWAACPGSRGWPGLASGEGPAGFPEYFSESPRASEAGTSLCLCLSSSHLSHVL